MDLFKVFLSSILSIIALFILTKLMGNRQMSSLSMFDYINGITIGSIAAELATGIDGDIFAPLLAMVIYGLSSLGISILTDKSIVMRRILTGRSILLFDNGKIIFKNFKRAHIDLNDFLSECRIGGYYNIGDLQNVFMEQNGKLSFLPKSNKRAIQPNDMDLNPKGENPAITIINDGKIFYDNLKFSGNNEIWLSNELKKQGFLDAKKIFYASCDSDNQLSIYVKYENDKKRDMFL